MRINLLLSQVLLVSCGLFSNFAAGAELLICGKAGVDMQGSSWRINWVLSDGENDGELRLVVHDTRSSSAIIDSAKSFGLVDPELYDSLDISIPVTSCTPLSGATFPSATFDTMLRCRSELSGGIRMRLFASDGSVVAHLKANAEVPALLGISSGNDDGSLDPWGPSPVNLGKFYLLEIRISASSEHGEGKIDLMTILKGADSCVVP